ncbi:hypothetical protein, partial [Arthrobacter sp. KK5.5]|uniref:hypothetical protein n=1 Tax=Arthrobacter sp. KK5.5 TaxID=3373084 RepID=UPI003EE48371
MERRSRPGRCCRAGAAFPRRSASGHRVTGHRVTGHRIHGISGGSGGANGIGGIGIVRVRGALGVEADEVAGVLGGDGS